MEIFRKKDIALATQIKEKLFRKREPWEQNLFVLWFGTFMAGIGFSLVMPFMSLYIDTLGSYTTSQLNFWSGITSVSYTHLRAHETDSYLVCRLLLEKKKKPKIQ